MCKTILLNCLFLLALCSVSFASENISENDFHGKEKPKKTADNRFNSQLTPFSLRSGLQFRGQSLFTTQSSSSSYVNLNTSIHYSNGQKSYVMPYKKKVILGSRITFNPNEATRNY